MNNFEIIKMARHAVDDIYNGNLKSALKTLTSVGGELKNTIMLSGINSAIKELGFEFTVDSIALLLEESDSVEMRLWYSDTRSEWQLDAVGSDTCTIPVTRSTAKDLLNLWRSKQ